MGAKLVFTGKSSKHPIVKRLKLLKKANQKPIIIGKQIKNLRRQRC